MLSRRQPLLDFFRVSDFMVVAAVRRKNEQLALPPKCSPSVTTHRSVFQGIRSLRCGALAFAFLLLVGQIGQADEKRNPLSELFRGIDRGIRRTGKEMEWTKTGRDQLDVRPVQRTDDQRRLAQAEDLIQKSRWHDAMELLQFLLDRPVDAFTFNSEQNLLSLQGEVDLMFRGLPEEAKRNYLNTFSTVADQRLRQAMAEQDEIGLHKVSIQYFHTPAGRKAAETLAQLWQERAEYAAAASCWRRLAEDASGESQVQYQRSLSKALASSGRMPAAREIAERLGDHQLLTELALLVPEPQAVSSAVGPYQTFPGPLVEKEVPNPNLTALWHAPLIERYSVRTQLRELKEELVEQGRSLIPTIQPLTIADKLAVRTLRSLQVRSLSTGELLWEKRMQDSPEQLAAKQNDEEEAFAEPMYYQETLFENHQLASLVFRDEVYGGLSSDGIRLFAIESSGEAAMNSPVQLWYHSEEGSATNTPWATNELAAYDLETGRLMWRIGGVQIEEPFSLPLAGTYFFGPPTPAGTEVFVIGEQNEVVTLFCLNARSGEQLWSQPLTTASRPIGIDTVRRHWPCRPVLAEGVIVCPTTCGWVAGVDQATHRLLWGTRYSPRNTQTRHMRSGISVQTMQELNRRWQCSVPCVSEGRVVLTPPDMPDEIESSQPSLVCIDLHSGQTSWSVPKSGSQTPETSGDENLYLAGIWNDQAILVGTTHVCSRHVSGRGEIEWSVPLPDRPSGRGVIVNGKLLVPVTSASLLRLDLKTGKIDLKSTLFEALPRQEKLALGNLAISGEQLVSVTYADLNVFPAFAQSSSPSSDALLLARQAMTQSRQQLAGGHWQEALATLSTIEKPQELPTQTRTERTLLEFDCLSARLETETGPQTETLEKLLQLATALNLVPQYERVLADHFLRQGNWEESLLLTLKQLPRSSPQEIVTEGTRRVRIDSWVGGRLQTLFSTLTTDSARNRFAELVQEALSQLPGDDVHLDAWARALSFHQLGLQLELKLAEIDFGAARMGAGLIRTQRVLGGSDPGLRTEARRLQAVQFTALKWNQDAIRSWQLLVESPLRTFANGESIELIAKEGEAAAKQMADESTPTSRWSGGWRIERMGISGDEEGLTNVDLSGPGFQALRSLRILQTEGRQRFRVGDARTGQFYSSLPAVGVPALDYQANSAAHLHGATAYIVHQGVLHALDWTKREIAWTWSPEPRGAVLSQIEAVQHRQHSLLMPASQFLVTRQHRTQRGQTGFLVSANDEELLLLCRDLIALDPISGEELWREQSIPERSIVEPLGNLQFMVAGRGPTQLRRSVDGRVLKTGKMDGIAGRNFAVVDGEPILLKRKNSSNDQPILLQRADWHGNMRWELELPPNSQLTLADEELLVWMSKENELFLVNLTTGQQKPLTKLSLGRNETQPPVRVLSDADRFYLVVDDGKAPASHVNLPGFAVSGTIIAFNRQGETLWTHITPYQVSAKPGKASPQRWPLKLLTQEFQENPLILLVSDSPDSADEQYFRRLRIIGIDKATGKTLIDWNQPSESGGFSYMHVDVEQRAIELRTYNEQLRIAPGKLPSAMAPAPPQ